MSQRSYFHDGLVTGDAKYAPYRSDVFVSMLSAILATDGGYVLPDVTNMLEVTAGGGATVDVDTGSAFVHGAYYNNDAALSLTISANIAGNPRFDRVVLRYDLTNKTVRAVIKQGLPSATPNVPTLVNNDTIKEMTLARIYVPDGFVNIADAYIYDERNFAHNPHSVNEYSLNNLMFNSEWVVFSGEVLNSDPPGPDAPIPSPPIPPDGWIVTSHTANSYFESWLKFSNQARGRTIRAHLANTDSFEATVLTSENFTGPFTLHVVVQVESGSGTLEFGGVTKNLVPSGSPVDIIIRGDMTGYQDIVITATDASGFSDIRLGPITLSYGYVPARPNDPSETDEIVFFDYRTTSRSASWNGGATVAATAYDDQDLRLWSQNYEFPFVMEDVKYLIARVEQSHADSAANYAGISFPVVTGEGTGIRFIGPRRPNDFVYNSTFLVPVLTFMLDWAEQAYPTINLRVEDRTITVSIEFVGAII